MKKVKLILKTLRTGTVLVEETMFFDLNPGPFHIIQIMQRKEEMWKDYLEVTMEEIIEDNLLKNWRRN